METKRGNECQVVEAFIWKLVGNGLGVDHSHSQYGPWILVIG